MRAEDETGEAVLAAASRLLREEGVAALSVRRVAAEAGQTTMAVYSRFGGKTGLLEALLREGFGVLAEAQDSVPISKSPRAELLALCLAYRRVALEYAAHYAVMTGGVSGFSPSAEVRERAAGGTLTRLVEASARHLALVGSSTTPASRAAPLTASLATSLVTSRATSLATALFGLCHGLCALELGGWLPKPEDAEADYRRAVSALIDGFASRPGLGRRK